jgi:hypothetical protein
MGRLKSFEFLIKELIMDYDYQKGFEEGYRMIMGASALLPLAPIQPLTPLGSTPFREGLKAGINLAKRNNQQSFNNIFK